MKFDLSKPKVTIAMPVYNGGRYFPLAVESALAQSYDNIEIVICNDGSDDGGFTDRYCQRITATHPDKVRYIKQENGGVAAALNTILDNATGDIFTWLSHDDLFLPDKIRKQVEFHAQIGNTDASLFSNYALINSSGVPYVMLQFTADKLIDGGATSLPRGMINGCTVYVPMHVMRDVGHFEVHRRNSQDYAFWNELLKTYDFYFQPECLVLYRIHPGQGTQTAAATMEGDILWKEMIDSRSHMATIQPWGSMRAFLLEISEFLEKTPYTKAARFAKEKLAESLTQMPLVSVVMPVFNEPSTTIRSVHSVLNQTYQNFELIVVDDGSTADMSTLVALCASDQRIRYVRQDNTGPAGARNHGLHLTRGDYICFIDADDTFLPEKIERQVAAMMQEGAIVSHTSYYVYFPAASQARGVVSSGRTTGNVYPEIIGMCPVATPTVMLNRLAIDSGHRFPEDRQLAEDINLWVDLALEYEFLGIDECLSEIEWSVTSAALRVDKAAQGLRTAYESFRKHPVHSQQMEELEKTLGETKRLERHAAAIANQVADPGPMEYFLEEMVRESISDTVVRRLRGTRESSQATFRQSDFLSVSEHDAFSRIKEACGDRTCLFITNLEGGGVARHTRDLAAMLRSEGIQVLAAKVDPFRKILCFGFLGDIIEDMCPVDLSDGPSLMAEVLRNLRIEFAHIHGLVGLTLESIESLYLSLLEADVPYYYTCHDYTAISPRLHLSGPDGEYVGRLSDDDENRIIARTAAHFGRPDIQSWRQLFSRILRSATSVIAPSHDVIQRVGEFYPDVDFWLRPHDMLDGPDSKSGALDHPIRVGVIGPLGAHKGSNRLVKLADYCACHEPDFSFFVYGVTDRDKDLKERKNVTVLGEYLENTFQDMFFRFGADAFFFPGTIPETFSYRLSEALDQKLPVIAFDIGAIGERLRVSNLGHLLPIESADTYYQIATTIRTAVETMNERGRSVRTRKSSFSSYYTPVEGALKKGRLATL